MTSISLDELNAIEPMSFTRDEAINLLVEDFGLYPERFDGLPTRCVQLRLRQEFNRRQPNSGLKLTVLEDAMAPVTVIDFQEPELVGAAS